MAITSSLAVKPEDLLESQTPAVRGIVDQICAVAARTAEQASSEPGKRLEEDERPHYAFLVDGGRGAGKTYTLLTISHVLEQFSELRQEGPRSVSGGPFRKFLFGSNSGPADASPANEESKPWKPLDSAEKLRTQMIAGKVGPIEIIRIIFPGDMMGGDSVMESVFAEMSTRLDHMRTALRTQLSKGGGENPDQVAKDLKACDDLATLLRDEVEQGWYFAKRFGLEPLYRDSLDYEDLVQRWGEQVKRASFRIDRWRRFVREYLDLNHRSILVVMIDDSDVRSDLTEDVLHSIRMFLNHPRIAIVLAGNLKSMRDALVYQAMKRLGPSVDALNQDRHPTGTDWRRRERLLIEEYLEKVLPPAQRYFIAPPRTDGTRRGSTSGGGQRSDFQKIAGDKIETYTNHAQSYMRKRFLDAKFRLALHRELANPDAPTPADRTSLEMFLAWWIFSNVYADTLAPTSARQIATFREYFAAFQIEPNPNTDKGRALMDEVASESRKRLPVALFDNPANHMMIQRLSDEDISVPDWLRRQKLGSNWSPRRTITINERDIHEKSFTYNFLGYRLDLGLAMPVRDNVDEVIPTELLPEPVGRKYMRRFFQPRQMPRRQRRLGVSRWIDHAAIPGNCIYFHDLQTVPDISCYPPKHLGDKSLEYYQSGGWEAQLADRWFELIEDRRESAEDESLLRYFREVVCESLRHTEHISTAELINELDPPDIYQKQRFSIYEHFITDEIGVFTATALERRMVWLGAFQPQPRTQREFELRETKARLITEFEYTAGGPPPRLFETPLARDDTHKASWEPRAPRRMIALYSALITDLRRAWLAVRLYGSARVVMGGVMHGGSETGSMPSLSVIANRDRMELYKRVDIVRLLERSPWIGALLGVFTSTNIIETFEEWEKEQNIPNGLAGAGISIEAIKKIFNIDSSESVVEKVQASEEPEDFRTWTTTLRSIGRSLCHKWPVHYYDVNKLEPGIELDLENQLFANAAAPGATDKEKKAHLLKIFDQLEKRPDPNAPPETDAEKLQNRADNDKQRRQNARSARNFVWLMYGLAPSLPALIHAHVMSQVYEAELMIRGHNDADQDAAPPYLKQQRPAMAKRARELYQQALKEVDEWTKLIGTLSVMMRYIKIKCLHLDTTLMFRKETDQNRDEVLSLVRAAGFTVDEPIPDRDPNITKAERRRRDEERRKEFATKFGEVVCKKFDNTHIASGLAIFPDVAPSTLFGDGWLTDILSRPGLSHDLQQAMENSELHYRISAVPNPKKESVQDNPVSVNGVFGETEQWLWSANRTLRKLNVKLKERWNLIPEPEEQAPPPPDAAPPGRRRRPATS